MFLVSLRHLHAFNAVAASGGIRRSSESLYRASSAVARSVAALEESLDAQLFERKGRGMLLTAAGDVVRKRADRIEAELHAVRDEAMRLRDRNGAKVGGIEALLNERRLQAASLLAEMHHMPSVAHVMGVSQSAVSQAIARLEDMLGQALFLRTAHGMVPTDAGRRWTESFERVLSELRHIPEDIAALAGVVLGVVTIGALPLARSQLLPVAISSVLKRHPQLQIRSLESPYEELTASLLSGRIDFIVGAQRAGAGDAFESRSLFEDKAALVARTGHPLVKRSKLTLEDLAGYPWGLSRSGTPLRESLVQFFERHGKQPPSPAVETGDLALLRGLLVSSDMLTVLSAHQLHHEVRTGQLVVLPFEMPGMERSIGVTTRKNAHLSPGAYALLAEIEAISRNWR
ncbi:LysR family transcriptional regulator, regulator for genes of the gallate degradation pathway [Duganella sp. CF402]|uniref:LysR family transcriptional regulator n=1 Tax=unclassified Duganella TaxID=2636909 RepID=UPI0008C35A44|nr:MULTISPECIES: LysR family transcriptional regulator [unclassified Duganella]RZT09745.1 LysR family transcriptional regulator [Duganella sp. BK701]SEL44646.1 LysR family transcriptional regulator, regulator for genes of the gallate degradation pathway [Duganella sp. CF402]